MELIPPQSEGGIENAEAEDGHHQDEEQIVTRRRRVTQERAFRDAIERKGESKQWVGAPGHFQQGSGSDTGRTHREPKERDAEPGPGESRRSERKVTKTEAKRSLVEEGETFSRPPKRRKRGEERREGAQSNSAASWESGQSTEVDEETVDAALGSLRRWLKENPMGIFYKWQWMRMRHMLVVGYSAYLRTGEMFRIRKEHVVLPNNPTDAAIIFLQDTKTSQRKQLSWEKVLIKEKQALACLRCLCEGRRGPDFLVDTSIYQFRKIWSDAVKELGLENYKNSPTAFAEGGQPVLIGWVPRLKV